jgi:hypothetical protein
MNIKVCVILGREVGGTVGIEAGYELDDRGSIPGGGKLFVLMSQLPDRS